MFKKLVLRLSAILIAAIATSLILSAGTSFAADRYWVGAGGNTSDTANWSLTSGGAGGETVPTIADIAYFDTNSGNATIDAALSVNSFQLLGDYTGIVTGGADTLTITGSFTISAGTFTAPSGTMKVRLNLTIAGGTFDPNSGTVEFYEQASAIDVNATQSFYNLTINQNNGFVVTIASNDVITVDNLLTLTEGYINSTGTARIDSIDSATAGDADVSIASTFDGGTGDLRLKGTTDFSIPAGAVVPSSTINNSALTVTTAAGAGQIKFDNTLTITDGTFDNTADVDIIVDAAYTQTGGTFYPGDATVLTIYSMDINGGTFDASTDAPTSLTTTITVNVKGTGAGAGVLDISNITSVTMGGIFLITEEGTVDASGVTTLSLNGAGYSGMTSAAATFTAPSATMRILYYLNISAGNFNNNSGTVEMWGQNGLLGINAPNTLYNLTLNEYAGRNVALISSVEIDGDLLISVGILNSNGFDITLAGDFTNNDEFTQSTGTVTLDGIDQTIGGSVNTTFYNLSKAVTSADTLSFANGTTTTVTNTTTLTGTDGNQLTLNSDLEGSQWSLNAAEVGRTINYVSIQDSNNTSGTDIDLTDGGAGEYGIDLLNNLNWILSAAPPPPVPEFTTWLYMIGMMLTGGYFYRERIFEAVQVS